MSVAKTERQFFMQQRGGGQHNTVGVVQPDVLIQDFQDQKMVLQLYQLFIAMATIITHVLLCWACYHTSIGNIVPSPWQPPKRSGWLLWYAQNIS